MALQPWSTFLDGKVAVSVDVISGSFAGISVVNTSGKPVTVSVWAPTGTAKVNGLVCPSQAAPTVSATLATAQRFAWTTPTDWRISVSVGP